jgi:diguanylate cyclase (GGDEF)-like protein
MRNPTYPKILIVEDDQDQRMLAQEALCMYYDDPDGTNITAVATAAQCLQQNLPAFDIILQDYHLPDMVGLDLLDEILRRADIPVIVVTGENSASTAADAIQHGAVDYLVKLGDYLFALPVLIDKNIDQHKIKMDNARLQRELQSMLSELRVKNIQLEESLERLEHMAATDPVTGLANRRRFSDLLNRHYGEAVRYGFDLTCCMSDLDHYKEFNDTFGHQVGDEILVSTAEIICTSLRESDTAARYGGDEFVLLLPHTAVDRALAVGQRIREELAAVGRKYGQIGNMLTLSMGVASLSANRPTSADELVSMADRALYAAKDNGKDQIVVYNEAPVTPAAAST